MVKTLQNLTFMDLLEGWQPKVFGLFSFTDVYDWIYKQLIGGEEPPEPTPEEIEEIRRETLAELGIPYFLDQLMNEYLGYLLLAGILLPAFLEYRRTKRMKMRLVG